MKKTLMMMLVAAVSGAPVAQAESWVAESHVVLKGGLQTAAAPTDAPADRATAQVPAADKKAAEIAASIQRKAAALEIPHSAFASASPAVPVLASEDHWGLQERAEREEKAKRTWKQKQVGVLAGYAMGSDGTRGGGGLIYGSVPLAAGLHVEPQLGYYHLGRKKVTRIEHGEDWISRTDARSPAPFDPNPYNRYRTTKEFKTDLGHRGVFVLPGVAERVRIGSVLPYVKASLALVHLNDTQRTTTKTQYDPVEPRFQHPHHCDPATEPGCSSSGVMLHDHDRQGFSETLPTQTTVGRVETALGYALGGGFQVALGDNFRILCDYSRYTAKSINFKADTFNLGLAGEW